MLMRCLIAIVIMHVSLMACAFDEAELTTILAEARQTGGLPGLRATVRLADGTTVRAAVGLADVEAQIPLDHEVGMPGGSTGKPFVAALTLLLVEDGLLSLDDPVKRWLGSEPWFHKLPNAETMQVRHLLSHSAGLRDYPGRPSFLAKMVWRVLRQGSAYFEPEELIAFARARKPLFSAGGGYKYTDVGYIVLGMVIEKASGKQYYALLKKRILEPLMLDGIRAQEQSALPDITPGYQMGVSNLKEDGRMKLDPRTEWTGGGLVTTPTMLVKFFAALAAGHVVSPESLQSMLRGGWHDPLTPDWHYGFGLFVNDESGAFSHGGRWAGYRTYVAHYPREGLTIATQTNTDDDAALSSLVRQIKNAASAALTTASLSTSTLTTSTSTTSTSTTTTSTTTALTAVREQ